MALLQVVQHVLNALGQTLALGLQRLLLGFWIQRQIVAGRHGCHPLLYGKANALACFFIGLHRVRHAHQCLGIEQIGTGRHGCDGIAQPWRRLETPVLQLCWRLQSLTPQTGRLLHILLLQCLEPIHIQLDRCFGGFCLAECGKRLEGVLPLSGEKVCVLLPCSTPVWCGIHACHPCVLGGTTMRQCIMLVDDCCPAHQL